MVTGAVVIYPLVWAVAASATRGGATAAIVAFLVYSSSSTDDELRSPTGGVVATGVSGSRRWSRPVWCRRPSRNACRRHSPATENSAELLQDRENLAIAASRAIADSPFIGTGLDNFKYVSQQYETRATPQAPHNVLARPARPDRGDRHFRVPVPHRDVVRADVPPTHPGALRSGDQAAGVGVHLLDGRDPRDLHGDTAHHPPPLLADLRRRSGPVRVAGRTGRRRRRRRRHRLPRSSA